MRREIKLSQMSVDTKDQNFPTSGLNILYFVFTELDTGFSQRHQPDTGTALDAKACIA